MATGGPSVNCASEIQATGANEIEISRLVAYDMQIQPLVYATEIEA